MDIKDNEGGITLKKIIISVEHLFISAELNNTVMGQFKAISDGVNIRIIQVEG